MTPANDGFIAVNGSSWSCGRQSSICAPALGVDRRSREWCDSASRASVEGGWITAALLLCFIVAISYGGTIMARCHADAAKVRLTEIDAAERAQAHRPARQAAV